MATITKAFNSRYGFSLESGEHRSVLLSDALSADRQILVPDEDGTLLLRDSPDSITSAMIADGAIVDEDINADADIAITKLASGTAGQVIQVGDEGIVWTSDLDLPGNLTVQGSANFIGKLNLGTEESLSTADVVWNSDTGAIEVGLTENISQLIGQSTYLTCRNGTGSTIAAGKAVMFTGTIGNSGRLVVAPMVADGTYPGYVFLGITAQAILAGEDGYVATFGKIRKINTLAYTEQQILWCDPATPGGLTGTEPEAPNLKLAVAAVVTRASNGTLMVRWDTGRRLADLHDVESNGATEDNWLLRYDAAAERWEPTPDLDVPGELIYKGVDIRKYSRGAEEAQLIRENATVTIGTPGAVPFGVGPILPTGMAFAGIGPDSYNVVDIYSGSFC